MKLDASNLGQIIGRLVYPDVEPAAPTAPAPARTIVINARGERQRELVDLLADGIERSCSDIATALKITQNNAAMLLTLCTRRGIVKRTGTSHSFRYSLP